MTVYLSLHWCWTVVSGCGGLYQCCFPFCVVGCHIERGWSGWCIMPVTNLTAACSLCDRSGGRFSGMLALKHWTAQCRWWSQFLVSPQRWLSEWTCAARRDKMTPPCGTPDVTAVHELYIPFVVTLCVPPVVELWSQVNSLGHRHRLARCWRS